MKRLFKALPGVRSIQEARYRRRFQTATSSNFFYGVYNSFEQAGRKAPPGKPLGYDNAASAKLYSERHERVYATDYPVLFWLERVLGPDSAVFELGGHTGGSFHAYRQYLNYGPDFGWKIQEVPAVVAAGQELASQMGESQLTFCTSPPADFAPDIALAIGSLQYVDENTSTWLMGLRRRPAHLILNLLPVTTMNTYFTVQNMGPAFCPYKIHNRQNLIDDLEGAGYRLVDEWENPEKRCYIPYSPDEYSLDYYSGFYFQQQS